MNSLKISKALSDKNRIKIIQMLSEDPKNVGEVAKSLNVEENLASHHLRVLASLGFLKNNKKGREVYYRLNKVRIVSMIKELMTNPSFKEILTEAMSSTVPPNEE